MPVIMSRNVDNIALQADTIHDGSVLWMNRLVFAGAAERGPVRRS